MQSSQFFVFVFVFIAFTVYCPLQVPALLSFLPYNFFLTLLPQLINPNLLNFINPTLDRVLLRHTHQTHSLAAPSNPRPPSHSPSNHFKRISSKSSFPLLYHFSRQGTISLESLSYWKEESWILCLTSSRVITYSCMGRITWSDKEQAYLGLTSQTSKKPASLISCQDSNPRSRCKPDPRYYLRNPDTILETIYPKSTHPHIAREEQTRKKITGPDKE